MKISQLRAAALHVLTEHIGVAAEFIIDDVISALEADPSLRDNPAMVLRQFFAKLEAELPSEINTPAVHLAIMRRARGAS
jgi:hypothetical protein